MEKEHRVKPALSKIYEILAEKYVIKSKWKKNQKRDPCFPKAARNHEKSYRWIRDKFWLSVCIHGTVDIFSKEADVLLRPTLASADGEIFLDTCMERRFDSYSDMIQVDGGPEFKDKFKEKAYQYTDRFRIARPYKKNEQAYIESFNRTVRRECLGWSTYKPSEIPKLTEYLETFFRKVSLPQDRYWSWHETTTRKDLMPDIYGNIPERNISLQVFFHIVSLIFSHIKNFSDF